MSADFLASAGIDVSGDATVLERLAALLDAPDPDFAIVTAENA
jgi:alkyl sulfatase BDS1-like metallo-beta-lactamase superfamily hydrolase